MGLGLPRELYNKLAVYGVPLGAWKFGLGVSGWLLLLERVQLEQSRIEM